MKLPSSRVIAACSLPASSRWPDASTALTSAPFTPSYCGVVAPGFHFVRSTFPVTTPASACPGSVWSYVHIRYA